MPANPTCFPLATPCNVVRFHIEAVLPDTRQVYASVKAVPAGFTLDQVPDLYDALQGLIIVCDPQGCYLNEPSGNLLGREGWAHYMQPLVPNICQPGYYPLVAQWEVIALCCPGPLCTF